MPSIRAKDSGKLFFEFRYLGLRCRELTTLTDTPANRRKMEPILKKIEDEIIAGSFDYARYFPQSKLLPKVREAVAAAAAIPLAVMTVAPSPTLINGALNPSQALPLFEEFARQWRAQKDVEWREGYRRVVDNILGKYLLPSFSGKTLGQIDRQRALDFRASLASVRVDDKGREKALVPSTVNRIMNLLAAILDEASVQHDISNPIRKIKRLKVQRGDIQPFTFAEVRLMLESVRADYRDYLTVRVFTGMRSGEVHGLKWKHVDFKQRLILVRETFNHGRTEYTKNDSSQREIAMAQQVYEALSRQKGTGAIDEDAYVFASASGTPIDNTNFDKRVWRPLLRLLGLKDRRPYQMRHTCATLWLAAGENPEWIARQLGHANTEMLFRVYSRYVPNLTRQDGSAFDRMVSAAMNPGGLPVLPPIAAANGAGSAAC